MSIANDLELYMLELINAERAAAGVDPLQLEQHLNDSSETHSEWVLAEDIFSHTGAGGSSSYDRMVDAGFDFSGSSRSGENIGFQSERGAVGLFDDVEDIHERLMDSTWHRWNILNPDYDYIGIGIEQGDYKGFDSVMITQNFAATDGTVLLDSSAGGTSGGSSGTGTDDGSSGSGSIVGDSGNNTLQGSASADLIRGLAGSDVLDGLAGADTMKGGAGGDLLFGGGGGDKMFGKKGNDTLLGENGQDILRGGNGQDTLDGGAGKDKLYGGAGADVFAFSQASQNDSRSVRDVIKDFDRSEDTIDLSGVDANSTLSGNQAFTFVGTDAFSGAAGELRYRSWADDAKREIQGDIDGDGSADFFILVDGSFALTAGDFIL